MKKLMGVGWLAAAMAMVILAIHGLPGPLLAAGAGTPPPSIPAPEPRTQARIEAAVSAVALQQADAGERVEALREMGKGNRGSLLLQLALYLGRADSTERSMGGALVLQQLEFSAGEKLDAVLPHLDTSDPRLRRVFTEMLGTIDRREGGEPDFTLYETRLRDEGRQPPPALVRYLYEVSPEAALASMERVYAGEGAHPPGRKPGMSPTSLPDALVHRDASRPLSAWSAADRERVRSALESLGGDAAWWRRLYAAEILRGYPELATPAMMERLKHDPDALVREAISR